MAKANTGSNLEMEQSEPSAVEGKEIPTAFDDLLSPMGRAEFLEKFWGHSFVRLTGEKGRFSSLLSWDDLNQILEHHRLTPPRLRLFRDGKHVEPQRYLGRQYGAQRLRPASLANLLSGGATLILDRVDELSPGVRDVTEAFEEALHATTLVNLYAGWRTQKGFDLHWDDQDTVILQVSGRKRWQVYRPTRLHPLPGEIEQTPKPTEEPIWEGVLEDGDILYMPRGWWHVAFPLDEPSLHLTVTIVPANGTDLLSWFVEQLKRHPEVRMNLPHPANDEARKQYSSKIRELITDIWTDDLLDRFFAEWNALPLRPRAQLPLSPIQCRAPITMETRLRLATATQLSFQRRAGDSISFCANGVWWECAPAFVSALELLSSSTDRSVRELCAQISGPIISPRLIALLASLAMGGVVWIEPGKTPDDHS